MTDKQTETPIFSPTMSKAELKENLEMIDEFYSDAPLKMSVLDGFEECLLYYMEDEDGNPHAVYCYEDMVETFARKNHTTYTEAVEFVDYNSIRTIPYMTHVGDTPTTKPIIIHRINQDYTTLEHTYFDKDYSDE